MQRVFITAIVLSRLLSIDDNQVLYRSTPLTIIFAFSESDNVHKHTLLYTLVYIWNICLYDSKLQLPAEARVGRMLKNCLGCYVIVVYLTCVAGNNYRIRLMIWIVLSISMFSLVPILIIRKQNLNTDV